MAYITTDVDVTIYPDEFFDACREDEKEELRDLVMEHYKIPHLDTTKGLADAVADYLYKDADTLEAKYYIQRVIADLEMRIKMRNFS